MSRSTKFFSPSLFLLISLGLAAIFSQTACTSTQSTAFRQAAVSVSNEIDSSLENASEVVFTGQVEDENGRWLNGYVVLLFQDGVEVARTITGLHNAPLSGSGPMDGVFELRVHNEYELTGTHQFYDYDNNLILMQTMPGVVGNRYIGTWFEDLNPSDMRLVSIQDKQLEYIIVVLDYTEETLPEHYRDAKFLLNNGVLTIDDSAEAVTEDVVAVTPVAVENSVEEVAAVPQPSPTPPSSVQFTILPKRSGDLEWNLHMTGFFGSRWDVWKNYVEGRALGITWETFKESVLVHNPQLEADGFIFYPEKSYLLPLNQ
jgi:hypothetical protein